MATQEQRQAVTQVCETIVQLNKAIDAASVLGITIELESTSYLGSLNRRYQLATSEIRERVGPAFPNAAG